MCSAAPNRKALAPSADKCTVFTGELVDVLRDGIPEESDTVLSLGVVFREVRRRLKRDNRPEPQEQDRNQVGDLSFTRNIAKVPTSSPPRRPRGAVDGSGARWHWPRPRWSGSRSGWPCAPASTGPRR
ncbi:hypothetical protein V5P93_004121 [Actinokineospora auranticolor]|uniref:Uncharacterized protein n=1 Tax=Actinokineospora auranticolor TaxID=155976 RepID=A0A2S6GDL7_9PSEU|nr:hypothetical protein [Actinokineospora auranticolor]PPK63186.1 hypothetical protein CLV40_13155 [Actinokineospora auranticolor]